MKAERATRLWSALLFLLAIPLARGAGVTVITHGYAGNVDGWVNGMAAQIPNYHFFPGASSTTYKLSILFNGVSYSYQWARLRGASPPAADSGEIIVELDWSDEAGGVSANSDESTYDVAIAASTVLLMTNGIPELGGHALTEFPIHLIGHSRGGSLVNEMSRVLGTQGVWVDHLTTLDPHPFNNDGNSDLFFPTDATAYSTYPTVLYRANYWQDFSDFDPNGEQVFGAYNRHLTSLSGGYGSPHSNVHLWYHGTVDERNPADDTEAQITTTEFNAWYVPNESYGFNAGFLWGLIGGGDRTSTNRPVSGGYAIRDGLNQAWDFGAGSSANRNSLTSNNGSWPDVIKFDFFGTNSVALGNSVSNMYYFQFGHRQRQCDGRFISIRRNPTMATAAVVSQAETGTGQRRPFKDGFL